MYRLKSHELVSKKYIGFWSLLAFQAGFINSIGFLACQRYVSHVTGFGTQIGISLGRGQYILAFEMLSLPVSFICGAWLTGHLTVVRKSLGLIPKYDWISVIMPVILLAVMIAGNNGCFGVFGEPLIFSKDFYFVSSLSFICGMQNACFATLTQGQVRTTHLTGISTDFGTDLSLILAGNLSAQERSELKRKNVMRLATILSFSTGALISAMIDARLQYWSLFVPFCTSIMVAAVFFSVKYRFENTNNMKAKNNSPLLPME